MLDYCGYLIYGAQSIEIDGNIFEGKNLPYVTGNWWKYKIGTCDHLLLQISRFTYSEFKNQV